MMTRRGGSEPVDDLAHAGDRRVVKVAAEPDAY
jgi:hypothetical protein